MIRINLLGVERHAKTRAFALGPAQRITLACSAIVVATIAGLGWWDWSLGQAAATLDAELASAQQEAARLQSVLAEVRQGEQRRAELQQRVALIQQLRSGQSVPVQLLDHVSRSLPDLIWLTELQETGDELTIAGRSTTLVALADFVANLGSNPALLQRPIEIVDSHVEPAAGTGTPQGPPMEVIAFTVRAQLATRQAAGGTAPAGTAAAAGGGTPPAGR